MVKKNIAQVVAAGLLVFVSSFLMISGPAGAVQNGGIGGRPANPDPNNPRSESIFIYTIKRGDVKKDQVLVSNNSQVNQRIKLYAVDGVVTNTGAYTCRQAAESLLDLGKWIALDSNEVTLTPGESKKIGFSVTVPSNADVGEHNACLVFENADDKGATQGAVRIHTRQAIRVVATIPGKLHRNIEITSFSATSEPSSQHFGLSLKNSGNVSADVDTHVFLRDMFGNVVSDNGGSYPVLADKKLDLQFDTTYRPFFGGWYAAQASISYNKLAGEFGVSTNKADLVIKESSSSTLFIMPTPMGGIIVLAAVLAVIGVIAWWMRRRQQANEARSNWTTYEVKDGDTLESLAASRGIHWKKVARHNDIRAPYTLTRGQEIRLPADTYIAKVDNSDGVRN